MARQGGDEITIQFDLLFSDDDAKALYDFEVMEKEMELLK